MDHFSTPFPVQAVVDTRESEPTSGPVDKEEGGKPQVLVALSRRRHGPLQEIRPMTLMTTR